MAAPKPARCLLLDVGGVLMTNGWDRGERERAAAAFKVNLAELESRHHLVGGAYEEGRLTLEQYLDWTVFHTRRPFTRAAWTRFMFDQSRPFPAMIALMSRLKRRHRLKVVVVNNEGRGLNEHRLEVGGLHGLADAFVSSCAVGLRKPDPAMYRLALDVAGMRARDVLYLDNTALFVAVAGGLGIRGLAHRDMAETRGALARLGLA